jgi:hypothetical protein
VSASMAVKVQALPQPSCFFSTDMFFALPRKESPNFIALKDGGTRNSKLSTVHLATPVIRQVALRVAPSANAAIA